MTVLITRPRFDKATNYLYYWSMPVIDTAKGKCVHLVDLAEEKANKTLLQQYCQKTKPFFFFLNGHGSADTIAGHENLPLITVTDNLSDFRGCLFYCRSCDVASILGRELVRNGAKGFIGYRRKFSVSYMPKYLTHPLSDPLARLFLEPSNLVPSSLIKGNSLGQAYQKSQRAMRTNLRKMLSSSAPFEERSHSQFLWSNIKSQVILGDPDAKI